MRIASRLYSSFICSFTKTALAVITATAFITARVLIVNAISSAIALGVLTAGTLIVTAVTAATVFPIDATSEHSNYNTKKK